MVFVPWSVCVEDVEKMMFVRPVRRFCDICLYSLNMGHRNWVRVQIEETKGAHFGTLKFELCQAKLYRHFFLQKLQKSPRAVSVKCEKANKWTRFLSER